MAPGDTSFKSLQQQTEESKIDIVHGVGESNRILNELHLEEGDDFQAFPNQEEAEEVKIFEGIREEKESPANQREKLINYLNSSREEVTKDQSP